MSGLKNKLIYFPSFSIGAFMHGVGKKTIIGGRKNKDRFIDAKFWSEDFKPKKLRYPYFLVTAGHFYKKETYRTDMDLDNAIVMGDSGGYQIASGQLDYNKDPDLTQKIFRWLEDNSDVAMNLDIPPRIKFDGKYQECLDISKKNFKYFYENQSGKTDFLKVIQGNEYESYTKWYDEMSGFEFQGMALGGLEHKVSRFMHFLAMFIKKKEHLNKKNKWLHILGDSTIKFFIILSQLQKLFNEMGIDIELACDSSSPNIQSRFGTYTTGYDLKKMNFSTIHLEKIQTDPKKNPTGKDLDKYTKYREMPLPICTLYDEYLNQHMNFGQMIDYTSESYVAFVQHNMYVMLDAVRDCDYYVNSHEYILSNVISKDMIKLLGIIEKMVHSDDPYKILQRNKFFIDSFDKNDTHIGNLKTIHNTNFFKQS